MSELSSIIAQVKTHPKVFDFTRETLGRSMLHIATETIIGQMGAEIDPDGAPWPPLSEAYAEWKSAHYAGQPMAVLLGLMRSWDEIEGSWTIRTDEIGQTYGVSAEARDLATWFQEGNANQPPRPFYAFNAMSKALLDDHLDQHFTDAFR